LAVGCYTKNLVYPKRLRWPTHGAAAPSNIWRHAAPVARRGKVFWRQDHTTRRPSPLVSATLITLVNSFNS